MTHNENDDKIKVAHSNHNIGTMHVPDECIPYVINPGAPNTSAVITILENNRIQIQITESIRTITYYVTPTGNDLKIEILGPLGQKSARGNNGEIYIIPTHLN